MHTYTAKDGTVFNYNPDLSGDVEVWPPDHLLGRDVSYVSGDALREFIENRDLDSSQEDDGVPWCSACQSWHPAPHDKEHHKALQCKARFKPHGHQ